MYALTEDVVCRRRASSDQAWNWNVGVAAPALPAKGECEPGGLGAPIGVSSYIAKLRSIEYPAALSSLTSATRHAPWLSNGV